MDDALLNEFINESREHLATIEADLLAIEECGAEIDEELVNKVFRAAHSIKGGSGFFGLNKVKELAHSSETVLDMLRSRKMAPNAEITNLLLAAFDRLRDMINHPAESASADVADLVVSLTGLASSYLPPEQKPSLTRTVTLVPSGGGAPVTLPEIDLDRVRRSGQYVYGVDYDLIHDIERQGRNVLQVFRDLWETGEILDCVLDFEAAGTLDEPIGNRLPLRLVFATIIEPGDVEALFPANRDKVRELLDPRQAAAAAAAQEPAVRQQTPLPRTAVEDESGRPPRPEPAAQQQPPSSAPAGAKPAPGGGAPAAAAAVEETIRVNVGILETLMNLAGELVLSRNQLQASIAHKNGQALATAGQRISQVTSELQDAIMQTRLQPVGNLFGKFPRVVRDMAGALGKEVQLDIYGKEVALDKSLIEGLSDPLTHMIRNAVDHGIEMPEERARAGKKRQGLIRIEARHEAGQVVVEIADDGKGIDPERVARAAQSQGLVTAEKLQGMSPPEKTALIFLPGLSTAEIVSDLSGRGVGMDVVKTNLDRLGGKVEILSEKGAGTTFRIKLPLTLAIIPSLIVSVDGERFAIPQINVEELLRVRPEEAKTRIEKVGSAEVLLLRDRLIPLVRFADLLGVVPTYGVARTGLRELDRRVRLADRRSPRHPLSAEEEETQAPQPAPGKEQPTERSAADRRRSTAGALEIAVVTTGTQTYGLVVGAFHDNEEIVVKPLGRHLKGLGEYAGATILGDGTVALILDVGGLAAKADLAAVSGTARARQLEKAAEQDKLADSHALLLFHNAPDELCAAPLDTVLRVERIRPEQVETVGGRRTLQYRGSSLPLVTLADTACVKPIGDNRDLAVIVSSVRGREVGLLGAMPVDVVETRADIDQTTHRQKGVAGSAIIRERTSLIADIFELVDAVWPEWATEKKAAERLPAADTQDSAVLLAEDSDFFRAQVRRYLEEDGYAVLAAADGEEAWELLLGNLDRVRAVVTDIEMPRLNGLGLARRIRADERTARLPVIALTSLAGDDDIARGKSAGIDDYQVKLDRDRLLERVRGYWASSTPQAAV
ncbi:MAG: chemotaxis protein CheW [bacterium]